MKNQSPRKPPLNPRAAKRVAVDTVSVEDVAVRLGIGRHQAYEAVRAGTIPSLRIGRRWLIPRAALERLLSGGARLNGFARHGAEQGGPNAP
jgi:excisionase family DNA binding protein